MPLAFGSDMGLGKVSTSDTKDNRRISTTNACLHRGGYNWLEQQRIQTRRSLSLQLLRQSRRLHGAGNLQINARSPNMHLSMLPEVVEFCTWSGYDFQ